MVDSLRAVFILFSWQVLVAKGTLRECKEGEYHYEYTECGSDGGRWHVPVPHDATRCSIKTKPPIRQKSCDTSCPKGQYSDVSLLSEKCKPCPKGTHSLGGAVHYSNWTVLPPEFDTYSVKSYDERMQSAKDTGCNSTWVADGHFLRTHGTNCVTRLTYSVNIVKMEGSLTFWYYYTNENQNLYFEVFVRNEHCQISRQDEDFDNDGNDTNDDDDDEMNNEGLYRDPRPSSNYEWKNFTLKLKRGENLVVWEVEHWDGPKGSIFSNTVFIRDMEVKGSGSSSECVPCSAGTYASKEGSSWCEKCPENQISEVGADKCTPCNGKTEYAPRGSATCLKRRPCKTTDYIETSSKCDKNNKFQTVFDWIEPRICQIGTKISTRLPYPGEKEECPPCNPGMYLNDTECLFCPEGTISDGKKPCTKCPASTAPVLNHDYRSWRSWPSTTRHWCSSYANGCSTPEGWQLRGHYLDSALGHSDDVTMYFEVTTEGFAGERGLVSRTASAVGSITIDFELDCDGQCVFIMYEMSSASRRTEQIIRWKGREPRQNYTYAASSKQSLTYRWKFKKGEYSDYQTGEKTFEHFNDRVKIYAVYLSNTLDGGASTCRKCPVGLHESGCVECPEGHYIVNTTRTCKACPKGTYLSKNTCLKCGPGLTSNVGSTKCFSSCHFHGKGKNGRHVDFSKLNGVHSVQTQKSFFSEGTGFIYEYRVNLCGVNAPPASCHSNASFGHLVKEQLNASICQMRIIPGKNGGPAFATTVAGIGHQLMGIYEEKPENLSLDVFNDEKLLNESLLYFDYLSHTITPSCPSGRSSWIILRCDPDADKKGTIKFPSSCHEGTCDGCQFLFLWHTKHACPLCTENHYNEIESGCVNSKKKIHYSWKTTPRRCVGGVSLPEIKALPCSDMSVHEAVKQFQILIGIVAFVLTAIIVSLFFLWYKNRVLKYKLYHRVAVNESNREEELPQAESCAMADEDDEFGEKVEFKKGENPGKKLMKKLKDMRTDKEESMKLSDSFEVDLN